VTIVGVGAMLGANVVTPLRLQSNVGCTATSTELAAAWSGLLAELAAPDAGRS
jgi:hypothetical protein